MQLHDAIRTRTTVHQYQPGDVDLRVIERAIEAAICAPNHRMTEPWRFTLVGAAGREAIATINADLKAAKAGAALDEPSLAKLRAKMLNPGALIVVSQTLTRDPAIEHEDYAAVACAAQNLMLSLHADGWGSKWSTGGVTTDPRTYATADIDPAVERIVGFIWIGRPADDKLPTKPTRRKTTSDVFRRVP